MIDNEITSGIKKKEQDQMRKNSVQKKGYKIIVLWESRWWEIYRTDATVKIIFEQISPINDLSGGASRKKNSKLSHSAEIESFHIFIH